jgi:hypothetical protein
LDPFRNPQQLRSYPTRCLSLYIPFRHGSDPIQKMLHPLPEWIRSYPTRCRSLYILSRNGSDPFRTDTGACTPFFRNGSDPTRSDTGAYASSSGMDPILSDPIPEIIPYIPVWNRSDPIRYRSLYILYRDESDPIRSGTGACALSFGVEPILSDPAQELVHPLPPTALILSARYRSLYIPFRNGSDPIQEIWQPRPLRPRPRRPRPRRRI